MKTLNEILSQLAVPIVAVTGTNGKSSVCKMIEEMLLAAGQRVFLAGAEFGPIEKIEGNESNFDVAVLELKSSVLQKLPNLKPKVAVLTSLVPAHFERHATVSEYFEAKKNSFRNQDSNDILIYNAEGQPARDLVDKAWSNKIPYTLNQDLPPIFLRKINHEINYVQNEVIEKFSLDHFKLLGEHQKLNAMAAIAVVKCFRVSQPLIQKCVAGFESLPDRLKKVGVWQERAFFSDLKAANPLATAWAVSSFRNPLILIMGGDEISDGYTDLWGVVQQKVKKIIFFGKARFRIFNLFKSNNQNNVRCYTVRCLQDAIRLSKKKSGEGECVLISPSHPLNTDLILIKELEKINN
ncbi:MAG: hypothetical protein HQM15_04185 [Deltaproteobacteria bacterium]|nr:hypothetical protein [Deltaproteobacteria bacterium]